MLFQNDFELFNCSYDLSSLVNFQNIVKLKQSFTSVLCCVTLTIQELSKLSNGKNKQHILVSYSLKQYKKTAVLIANDFGDRRLIQLMKFIKSWIKILSLTSRCEMQNNQHYCACAMTLEYIGLMTSGDGNNAENFLVVVFLFSVYCIKNIFSHPKNQTILVQESKESGYFR